MKKLTDKEAIKMLQKGRKVYAELSKRGDYTIVKSESELQELVGLRSEGVQMCNFFTKVVRIPEQAIEVSLDEAIDLISKGEAVNCKTDEAKEEQFTSINALMAFYRSAIMRDEPLLYWYV